MYKFAAQKKLRFDSIRGQLTVEQLFDLPLSSDNGFDLDTVARAINARLRAVTEESFVETRRSDNTLETMLEIVKDVIKTKQEAALAQRQRIEKAEQRRKLLDIMSAKQDKALSETSLEELEKKLAELDE